MNRRPAGEVETSNKRPPVLLGKSIVRLLRHWRAKDRPDDTGGVKYVIHYEGKRIEKLRRSWSAACTVAKLSSVSPHTLRHARATWLMQAGIGP